MTSRAGIRDATIRASFTVKGSGDEPLQHEVDFGDIEHLRSLLLDFRKFTARKEDLFFPNICNLVETDVTHDVTRANFVKLRQQWATAERGGVTVVVNAKPISARGAFDLLVNGRIFHEDEDKSKLVDSLPRSMQDILHYQMVDFIINGIKILVIARNHLAAARTSTGY